MPTSPRSCSLKWNVWFLFIFNLRPKKTASWDSRCPPRIQKLLWFAFLMEVPREIFDESFLPLLHYLHNNVVTVAGQSHEYSEEGQPEVTELFFPLNSRRRASADWAKEKGMSFSSHLDPNCARNEYFLRGDTITESEGLLLCLPLQTRAEIIKLWKQNIAPLSSAASSIIQITKRQTALSFQPFHMRMATGTEGGNVALLPNPTAVCC